MKSDGFFVEKLYSYAMDDQSVIRISEEYTVEFDEKSAVIHANIQAKMEQLGNSVPYDDSMIAATALANNMTLVTRNTKHFECIAREFGLQLENWFLDS